MFSLLKYKNFQRLGFCPLPSFLLWSPTLSVQSSSTTMMADFVSIFMTKDSRQIDIGKILIVVFWIVDNFNLIRCSFCKLMFNSGLQYISGHYINLTQKAFLCSPFQDKFTGAFTYMFSANVLIVASLVFTLICVVAYMCL